MIKNTNEVKTMIPRTNLCAQTLSFAKYDEVVHLSYNMQFAQNNEPGIKQEDFYTELARLLKTKRNPLIILGGTHENFDADHFENIIFNLIKISAPRVHIALDELPSFDSFNRLCHYLYAFRQKNNGNMPVFTAFGSKNELGSLNEMLFAHINNANDRKCSVEQALQIANEIRTKDEFDNDEITLHQITSILAGKIAETKNETEKQDMERERTRYLNHIITSGGDNHILKNRAQIDLNDIRVHQNPYALFVLTAKPVANGNKAPIIPQPKRY